MSPPDTRARLLLVLGAGLALGPARAAAPPADPVEEVRAAVADRGGAARGWAYNISVFQDRVDALFKACPAGQRRELAGRIAYARAQAEAEIAAGEALAQALVELAKAPGVGKGVALERALEPALAAFDAYAAGFDAALLQPLGLRPRAHHRRLFERWQQAPELRLLLACRAALVEEAARLVSRASALMEARRERVYDAVRDLQYAPHPLGLMQQARLDRVFALLQAGVAEKHEPGLGVPRYQEFPTEHPYALDVPLHRVPEAELPELPASPAASGAAGLAPEVPAVDAFRVKEVHDLAARYRAEAREAGAADRLWEGYTRLRDRWFRVGGGS